MRIDVYTILRNERVMLPYFLRHYGSFADHLFVFDDRSDDGSREMLDSYDGPAKLSIFETDVRGIDDYYFRKVYQTAYKDLSRGWADWVLCVDADEFIYHPHIRNYLDEIGATWAQIVYPTGWNMFAAALPTTGGQIYEEIKTGVRDPWFDKPVVFRPEVDMKFTLGRHRLHKMPGVVQLRTSELKLLHYRNLGQAYCADRHQRNYQRFSTDRLRAKHGKHVTGETYLHSLQWYADQAPGLRVCV